MYGVGPSGSGAQALPPHNLGPGGNPILSQGRFNPAVDDERDVPIPTVSVLHLSASFIIAMFRFLEAQVCVLWLLTPILVPQIIYLHTSVQIM